jgi:hypothetical protein
MPFRFTLTILFHFPRGREVGGRNVASIEQHIDATEPQRIASERRDDRIRHIGRHHQCPPAVAASPFPRVVQRRPVRHTLNPAFADKARTRAHATSGSGDTAILAFIAISS